MQRDVLGALDASRDADPFAWVSARALAAKRAGGTPTRAQVESVNRALRTLARRGLAELGFVWTAVPTRHPASASGTVRLATAAGRRPVTPDQVARANREEAERLEQLRRRLAAGEEERRRARRLWRS